MHLPASLDSHCNGGNSLFHCADWSINGGCWTPNLRLISKQCSPTVKARDSDMLQSLEHRTAYGFQLLCEAGLDYGITYALLL